MFLQEWAPQAWVADPSADPPADCCAATLTAVGICAAVAVALKVVCEAKK